MRKANKEAIEISRLINNFLLNYAPTHITDSRNTLHSYEITISLYLTFLEEEKAVSCESLCAHHFEREIIEAWIEWLTVTRECCPSTCNVRLGALRTFLNYLGNRTPAYMYLHNEATTVPIKKVPKKKINGLSKAAVKALLSVPDTTTLTGIRDLVLMLVLYSTAARIDEVLSIQIKHIFLKTSKPYINIIGKGNKARTLTLLPKVVTYIEKYGSSDVMMG